MSATLAKSGFGTKFQRDNGAGTFQDISEIMDFTGPETSQDIVDATHMGSPGGWAEKIATGVRDAGEVSFPMNFIPGDASQALLEADSKSSSSRKYRVIFSDGVHGQELTGIVKTVGKSLPMRDKMVSNVVIAITGEPVDITIP